MREKLPRLSQEHLERLNIGQRFWDSALAAVPDSPVARFMFKYLSQLDVNRASGWGVMLYGPNGVGKTFIATAALKSVALAGYSAYCIPADRLSAIYIDGSVFDASQTVVQRVEQVEFLLLEDVGKEYSGHKSGWSELCFENLLRQRVRELLPTWLTTNLTPDEFSERYQKSAVSLAMESMLVQKVEGKDWRKELCRKKMQEYSRL